MFEIAKCSCCPKFDAIESMQPALVCSDCQRMNAAAPDILSAAQAVMQWVEGLWPNSEDRTELVPVFKALRAAIAKATASAEGEK